jgi:hypothetical protein
MNRAKVDVNAEWDAEANGGLATSDELPRLVREGPIRRRI